jgi:PAS domain S-box-containing protein
MAKGSWEGEFSNRRKDGSPFTTFAHITALELSGKKHWVCVQADITERKRAEESLRISEERFDLAVRGSNTGIWDWDLRTNKTYFSPLWKSMLGYEENELRGEFSDWEERLHPDDCERALATVRAYLDGITPQYELEHRLRHKDGSYRWILARGVSISDAEGNPYRMAGSHIDITDQRQTQEALAQSERQLRTVLDALPVGVWFTDQSGKPVLSNPAAKEIWSGIKQIRIETAPNTAGWWETIGPSGELHRWALSHALTKRVPSLNETLDLECLDGTKKTIRNTSVPVQDEAGVVLGAIVLNEDITALRQAQEALKLTQFSVDHAVEGFFWIGHDARILNVNNAACRMLEYTRDELTTMTMHDIDPNLSSDLWSAYWKALKQKGSMTFESKLWSKTGRILDTEVTINYLCYEGK